jgi:hypothetical protein
MWEECRRPQSPLFPINLNYCDIVTLRTCVIQQSSSEFQIAFDFKQKAIRNWIQHWECREIQVMWNQWRGADCCLLHTRPTLPHRVKASRTWP